MAFRKRLKLLREEGRNRNEKQKIDKNVFCYSCTDYLRWKSGGMGGLCRHIKNPGHAEKTHHKKGEEKNIKGQGEIHQKL